MSAQAILQSAIIPALQLLPAKMDSDAARIMLLAIGLQESNLEFRRQHGNGPATGLWQFEAGGGVKGVLRHEATQMHAFDVCHRRGVTPTQAAVWSALQRDDVLAAAFARLLLWSDPAPLPTTAQGGWDLYARTWRPGKPRPAEWPENFQTAKAALNNNG